MRQQCCLGASKSRLWVPCKDIKWIIKEKLGPVNLNLQLYQYDQKWYLLMEMKSFQNWAWAAKTDDFILFVEALSTNVTAKVFLGFICWQSQRFSSNVQFQCEGQKVMSCHLLIQECCQNMTCPNFALSLIIWHIPGAILCFAKDSTRPNGWIPRENLQMNISLGRIGDFHQKRFAPTDDETFSLHFSLGLSTEYQNTQFLQTPPVHCTLSGKHLADALISAFWAY